MKDPFNGKRGRQKGQTKDMVVIKDEIFAPYEIHQDKNCFALIEPGNNGTLTTVGYFSSLDSLLVKLVSYCILDKQGQYTFKEYIKEYRNIVDNLKQIVSI
jgi:hypothetical protein